MMWDVKQDLKDSRDGAQVTLRGRMFHSFGPITANDKAVIKAVNLLNSLGKSNEVTLSWIPAHSGFEGNELADRTAKAGSANDNNSPEKEDS